MYKPNKMNNKKSTNPVATDADYDRMNEVNGEASTLMLAKEMGSKSFNHKAAKRQMLKAKCLALYLRGRTYSEASSSTGVAKRTVFDWFEEFKILFPILK